MANLSSTGAAALGKSSSHSFPNAIAPTISNGLVQHPALSPAIQVQILSVVDATGSASIGDIVAELPDSENSISAILALVAASMLSMELRGVLDANTVVSRAAPTGGGDDDRPPSGATPGDIPPSIETHIAMPFVPQLFVGAGSDRRDFARASALGRPGVYILMNDNDGYVGLGSNVGQRVATGQQPIDGIETVIAVVDANNFLTAEDARVVERILWSRLSASGERQLVNGVPDGAAVDPQRYSELDAFAAQACLTMRHQGLLFTRSSARAVLAGPRSKPGRLEKDRPLTEIPAGEILELNFGKGLMAVAARQSERRWVLLCGSDVRRTPVPSANGTAGFLRAAWAHSGLLDLSHDGSSYTTQRDLVFSSGSAAAQFCAGVKGHGLWAWRPIDREAGFDPDSGQLITA